MDIQNFVSNIKELVSKDKLEQAIQQLKSFMENEDEYNEIIIQSARFSDIEKQIRSNLVSKVESDVEKNKIRLAKDLFYTLIASLTTKR